ncbi:MAG TPA: CRTAC1 family protein [Bryobacteraceae bacterium]|nr:CRTAC1 family protein [Bryobacteraceae bacterium]
MKQTAVWIFLAFAIAGGSGLPDFQNVSKRAGVTDVFPNGGTQSKDFIIETTGSGIALVDYDNDGLLDLFVLSGRGGTNRMYHNDGHDRFHDVTEELGLKSDGWSEGVCAGDYDNDGYTDLFVTSWGANHLYRNIQGKHFADVTENANLRQPRVRYNTGCAFFDMDGDGRLDLFVANYLKFDPATTPHKGANPYCFYLGIAVNCGPRGLPFDRNILYRNLGNGKFEDVSEQSGIAAPDGHYSLSVLTGDFNEDGLPDIYVACDQTPSLLYINKGNGKFEEEGVLRGVAFDQNGKAMSGMGVATVDTMGQGHFDIFRTNFSDEFETLYHNRGKGIFDDVTLDAGLGLNTKYVGWGTGFFDYNNDGWPDLMLVNGHVFPEVDALHSDIHYLDRAILYENLANGKFHDISKQAGPAFAEVHSSRGAAFGDLDNDGSVEVAVNNQNEPPSILKNTKPPDGHWLILKLIGTRANASAIGARVQVAADGHTQAQEVRSGGSYLSQNDLRLHFGVSKARKVDRIEISWPGGEKQLLTDQAVDKILTIKQP